MILLGAWANGLKFMASPTHLPVWLAGAKP